MTTTTAPNLRTILAAARSHGLGHSALALLCLLHERGEVSMTLAAREIGVSTASTTGIADTLDHLGYAYRSNNVNDRRGVTLEITPRGVLSIEAILAGQSSRPAQAPRKSLGLRLTR